MKVAAAIMLKAPRPGTVKTRLAAQIGYEQAAHLYKTLASRQLREIPDAWQTTVYYSPADALNEMRQWLAEAARKPPVRFRPQCDGDLGARMLAAVHQELSDGADAVVLLGGDCPELTTPILLQLEAAAQTADVVIIPALDGGYVAMLVKAPHPGLFQGIPWSTPHVCHLTCEAAQLAVLNTALLPPLTDIDDAQSLIKVAKNILDPPARPSPYPS